MSTLEDSFRTAAHAATTDLPFDADRTLAGVARRRRRRRAQRVGLRALPAALAVGVAIAVGPGLLSASDGHGGTALAPYAFAAAALPPSPAAEVDGVIIGNLPAGTVVSEPVHNHYAPSPASVQVTIAAPMNDGGITVTVARAEGLTLDSYLDTNWFRGTPTTVSGRPAMANSIRSDNAAGLVWSPADGVVIEAHAASDRTQELRELVENMHLK